MSTSPASARWRRAVFSGLVPALLFVVAAAVITPGAGAGPAAARSAAPLVGLWNFDGKGPVLRIDWVPTGFHGPKTEEFVATVISEFRIWSDGTCVHRPGEVLFAAYVRSTWPYFFEGTAYLATADWYYGSQRSNCSPLERYTGINMGYARDNISFSFCFGDSAEKKVCRSGFTRAYEAGESHDISVHGPYVFPGQWEGGLRFIVDAGGPSWKDPSGRWIRSVERSASLKCAAWSVKSRKWLPELGMRARITDWPGTIPIKDNATVSSKTAWRKGRTAYRLELEGSFTAWTVLKGTVRYVTYSPVTPGAMPRNLDKPGKLSLHRCDSGAVKFESRHVPGSWQGIAGGRG